VNDWVLAPDSMRSVEWVPLAISAQPEATLVWLPVGAGGILAIAEAEALANGSLASSNLAVVAARALVDVVQPGDTVFFSEFHQGLDGRRGVVREALGIATDAPWGRAALHLAVLGFVLLVVSGASFGAPAPEPEGKRRSPLEHVEALARIHERAESRHLVARRLVRGAARRMGLHQLPSESDEQLLERLGRDPRLRAPAGLALAALGQDPPNLSVVSGTLDAVVNAYNSRKS
jgi:hypothetical protein